MPSREKMMMKRKSSSNREAMDFMEFSREATRLLSDAQCLQEGKNRSCDLIAKASPNRPCGILAC